MPEPQDPDGNQGDDGSVGNSTIQQMRKQIKDLEADAKKTSEAEKARADAAEAKLAVFERSAAFDRLNIPPTGPGKLFREHYQGELTDEAITAAALEYELIKAPNPNTPTIPGVDQAAMARMTASLPGSQQSSTPPSAMEAINGAQSPKSLISILSELGAIGE